MLCKTHTLTHTRASFHCPPSLPSFLRSLLGPQRDGGLPRLHQRLAGQAVGGLVAEPLGQLLGLVLRPRAPGVALDPDRARPALARAVAVGHLPHQVVHVQLLRLLRSKVDGSIDCVCGKGDAHTAQPVFTRPPTHLQRLAEVCACLRLKRFKFLPVRPQHPEHGLGRRRCRRLWWW